MTFAEAEVKYRELHKQKELGKPPSRSEFEDRVSKLVVRDDKGTWWEIHPYSARWMYYDGKEWIYGTPPTRSSSEVLSDASKETQDPPAIRSATDLSLNPEHRTTWSYRGAKRITSRQIFNKSNRVWLPLAIASLALFICTCLLFGGGQFLLPGMSPTQVPTQILIVAVPTPPLMPTITLAPTIPAPTETPASVIGRIVESRVNVRAAPSIAAKIIGKVTRDDQVTLIGRSDDGAWYQVQVADIAEPSWIFGETMEIASGDPARLPVVSTQTP